MMESHVLASKHLERSVTIDFYFNYEAATVQDFSLLLINDGQDLVTMNFEELLAVQSFEAKLQPLICIGIHCGEERMNEYGMIVSPDYKGRGKKGKAYEQFILHELLPYIDVQLGEKKPVETAIAGFSLGGLNAMDLAWHHPELFSKVGVFSGSFWWRSKSQSVPDYNQWNDRLMHKQVAGKQFHPGMKFFFECGDGDEQEDRNKNGVIDSIDDTLDLMRLLVNKGYREGPDIKYLQLKNGRHDVNTWARALPVFLQWGWSNQISFT